MKKFLLSCLVFGLMLTVLSSCSDSLSQFEKKAGSGNKSATAYFFPEPCLNWGVNSNTLTTDMVLKGYSFSHNESEDGYEFLKFSYALYDVYCSVSSDVGYWHAFYEGVPEEDVKKIMNNYSNDSDYKKLGEKYYDGGMIYAFQSTDNKTFIYAQAMGYDSCILYYSKMNASEECAEYLEMFN